MLFKTWIYVLFQGKVPCPAGSQTSKQTDTHRSSPSPHSQLSNHQHQHNEFQGIQGRKHYGRRNTGRQRHYIKPKLPPQKRRTQSGNLPKQCPKKNLNYHLKTGRTPKNMHQKLTKHYKTATTRTPKLQINKSNQSDKE